MEKQFNRVELENIVAATIVEAKPNERARIKPEISDLTPENFSDQTCRGVFEAYVSGEIGSHKLTIDQYREFSYVASSCRDVRWFALRLIAACKEQSK